MIRILEARQAGIAGAQQVQRKTSKERIKEDQWIEHHLRIDEGATDTHRCRARI